MAERQPGGPGCRAVLAAGRSWLPRQPGGPGCRGSRIMRKARDAPELYMAGRALYGEKPSIYKALQPILASLLTVYRSRAI